MELLIAATVRQGALAWTYVIRRIAPGAELSQHWQLTNRAGTQGEKTTMPRYMDFHQDLKLPDDAIAQIADDTRHGRADEFGVRQVELYHNADGAVYCLLEGPNEEAIRQHHAALGVPCGGVHQVDSLT
jgi:Protein of unknown function (DUF4242)